MDHQRLLSGAAAALPVAADDLDDDELLAQLGVSLNPHVVEKDYALGWALAGIYAHPELASSWVFKGGTCLKKCYFETYRFSEDLDFTLRDGVPGHVVGRYP